MMTEESLKIPNVLIACEESQRVCIEFRKRGINAFSCDLQECSGGHPEWHIQGDALPLINGNVSFKTAGGQSVTINGRWDMIIAHPPCTYLSNAGTRSFSLRVTPPEKVVSRWEKRAKAVIFFLQFIFADCDKIAVENPVGFINSAFRKPDQIIDPYQFAEDEKSKEYVTKRTCLWLKGLPKLEKNGLPKPILAKRVCMNGKTKSICWTESVNTNRACERSKTFHGIAKAMAEQWGKCLLTEEELK